jgi:ADP-heptose:LPS heptosyltransferase
VSAQQHIVAFYSRGPHFARLLRHLRRVHPDARLSAMIPPGFPADTLTDLADAVLVTPAPPHGLRNPGALSALVRQIRATHCTRFVVMFDSARLRLVAMASGAPERWCFGPDGSYTAIQAAPLRRLCGGATRRLRGWTTWLRIWIVVHTTRVK